jgi:hypothetical protein
MRLSKLSGLHDRIAKEAKLPGVVWCRECGRSKEVDPGRCLAMGWPLCCGYTMSLDAPEPVR